MSQSRAKSKTKSSKTQHSDLEDTCCVLCLKPAVRKHSNKRRRHKVKYLFTICCKVLKIKESDPIVRFSKELAFCMGCLCILKDCDALFTKLEEIQTSLKKIEIDMKATVIKSQQFPPSSVPINDNSNSTHYQEFRYIAIKDFSPDLKLLNVSTPRNRKYQTKIASSEKMVKEVENEDSIIPEDIEIKQEYYYSEDGMPNSPFNNMDSDGGGDWQTEMDNKVHGPSEIEIDIQPENQLDLSVSNAQNVNNTDTDTVISEQNASEATKDSDIESKLNEDGNDKLKEKQDPEYIESSSSDSSDEDYTPSKTKKRKISPRSKPKLKLEKTPKKVVKRKAALTEEAEPNKSTADGTPKVKKRFTKKSCARLNQLDGVEFKISDNKWSYRSIEYSFNEEKQCFECTVCDMTTYLQLKMRAHIGNMHGVDERYGIWHYGGVKYSYDKERKRFVCSVCNEDFSSRNTIGRHIKMRHHENVDMKKRGRKRIEPPPRKAPGGQKPPVDLGDGKWLFKNAEFTKDESGYTCSICKRFRKGWHSMLLHICECHNDEVSKLQNQCPHCGKCFGTKYRLKDHLPVHSVERSRYQCTECGDFFRYSGSLWGHIARVHEKRRPYICEYCGKSFFTRKDCRVHVRVHTKERPYVCTYEGCGNTFSLSATLKSHQKSRGHDLVAPVVLTSL